MAAASFTATIGASHDAQGQYPVEVTVPANLDSVSATVSSLASIGVGGLTTVQVGTLTTAAAQLASALAADILVHYNSTPVPSKSVLGTATRAIVKKASDLAE